MISLSVKSDIARVIKELDGAQAGSRKAVSAALNRVIKTVQSRTVKRGAEVYNITQRDLRPFVTLRNATARAGGLEARITFTIRPVPVGLFNPKIRMQTYTIKRKDGSTFKRKLPTVYLKRKRAGNFRLMPGVFPLHTRSTGRLQPGDKLKRRIGSARDRLTGIRVYILPPEFVQTDLLPLAKAVVGERFVIEFRSAYRKFVGGRSRVQP